MITPRLRRKRQSMMLAMKNTASESASHMTCRSNSEFSTLKEFIVMSPMRERPSAERSAIQSICRKLPKRTFIPLETHRQLLHHEHLSLLFRYEEDNLTSHDVGKNRGPGEHYLLCPSFP